MCVCVVTPHTSASMQPHRESFHTLSKFNPTVLTLTRFLNTDRKTETHTLFCLQIKHTLWWKISAPWQQPTASLLLRSHEPINGLPSFLSSQWERSILHERLSSLFQRLCGSCSARLIIAKICGCLRGNAELFINTTAVMDANIILLANANTTGDVEMLL